MAFWKPSASLASALRSVLLRAPLLFTLTAMFLLVIHFNSTLTPPAV